MDKSINEVRFGAWITVKVGADKKLEHYHIVGVDEADVSKGKISFISPVAKVLANKKVGNNTIDFICFNNFLNYFLFFFDRNKQQE